MAQSSAESIAELILAEERRVQHGVVSWPQLRAAGWSEAAIRRAVRRRELVRVHPRVYVDHTGPLTWGQRRWAALLWAWPAALCGDSIANRPLAQDAPVHVAIEHARRLGTTPGGVVVHRVRGLAAQLSSITDPPRLTRADNALLLAAAAPDGAGAIAAVADAVSAGMTSAQLLRALDRHPQMRHRHLVAAIAPDLEAGAHSVLEHLYLTQVERSHGLPVGVRQAERTGASGGREFRDVAYSAYWLVVELDGRLNHGSWAARQRDAQRDLDDVAAGHLAVRLTWAQVAGSPCGTAARIAQILRKRGWTGTPRRCGATCMAGWGV